MILPNAFADTRSIKTQVLLLIGKYILYFEYFKIEECEKQIIGNNIIKWKQT